MRKELEAGFMPARAEERCGSDARPLWWLSDLAGQTNQKEGVLDTRATILYRATWKTDPLTT